jgi:hypothetical protein
MFQEPHCQVPKTRGTHNQRLRKTKRYPQTRRAKIADETPRLRSDSYEACSTGRLDYILTRTRHAQRDASTAFRLVRGTLDGMPRLRSNSYEAPSTGRLDCVLTCTRLARQGISTIRKSPTRMTLGRSARPTLFTNSETKVRAFNATTYYFLPSWLQQ